MFRPTAAHVRATVSRTGLSESALANLTSRGRLSQEVIDAYNVGKRGGHRYTSGNSGKAAEKGRAGAAQAREALRASGVEVGKRGPLPGTRRAPATSK